MHYNIRLKTKFKINDGMIYLQTMIAKKQKNVLQNMVL